jgi:energy-coupling factor transporter ATP-binding protein EcfA2
MPRAQAAIDLSKRIFIRQVSVNSYKCFTQDGCTVTLNVPNGTPGSGLTILVGANGVGKTSILEALNLVTEGTFTVQNRLKAFDFHKEEDALRFEIRFDKPCQYKMPDIYRGSHFACNGVIMQASFRDHKSPGRLLSPALRISTLAATPDIKYTNQGGNKGGTIEEYHKSYDDSKLDEPINIFYFDKARARHITSGTFTTTFDRIVDDLNWKFLKGARANATERQAMQELGSNFEKKILELTGSPAGKRSIEETKKFFGRDDLGNIGINLLALQWPFSNAFFASKEAGSLAQIPVAKLGSGIEMVFTLHLLRAISEQSKGSVIYLIDEPELSLHPQAQRKLLELLVEESTTKQVVIATHSSHFVDPSLITKIVRFRTTKDGPIIPYRVTDTSLIGPIQEERRVFFRRHRDLFFTDQALFVEGIDDYERYGSFCERNGFPELVDRLVMMNGSDSTFSFEALCKQLGISFVALVDRDFSVKRSFWARERNRSYMARVLRFIKDKGIGFDEPAFQVALNTELIETLRNDDHQAEVYMHDGTQLLKVKGKDIFVLRDGEVCDYLDANGDAINEAKKNELLAIFDAARYRLLN